MSHLKTICNAVEAVSASTQLNESSAVFIKLVCFPRQINAAWEFFEEKRHKFQQQIKIILDSTNHHGFVY